MATGGPIELSCKLVNAGDLKLKSASLLDLSDFVVSGDMLIVADWRASNIQVYRRHDGFLLARSDKFQPRPTGICFINDKEISVTLENSTIEIMSVEYNGDTGTITKVRTLHANTTFDECDGVERFHDNVVVSGWKEDNSIYWCIVPLNNGTISTIHQVCKGDVSYLTINENVIYISCHAADSGPDNTGVYGYYIQNPSKQTFRYKHKELNHPRGISVDNNACVFVCNWDPPCIHHLTDKCELVTIYTEGIPSHPQDISLDQGILYVISYWSNVVQRYRLVYSHQQGDFKTPQDLKRVKGKLPANEETSNSDTGVEKEMVKESNVAEKEIPPFNSIESTKGAESEQEVLPPEILNMGHGFQELYRDALSAGKENDYNIRVMIVGHQGVGKTSLTRRLLGAQVTENETESTEGIEVHTRCCQIDHATGEWKRKIKKDELLLNDQRIASIVNKYKRPQDHRDIKVTDPDNGSSPAKKRILSMHDQTAVPLSLDAGPEIILKEAAVGQIVKEAVHITESDGDVPNLHVDKNGQIGNGLDEADRGTDTKEIEHFLERAPSLIIPKRRSSDVTLLDFAGQSLFYTTHQAFMSWRTLYLLVTNMSLPLTDAVNEGAYGIDVSGNKTSSIQDNVTYWLNSVHSHVPNPEYHRIQREETKTREEESSGGIQTTTMKHPFVILVGTHSDKIPKDLLEQRKKSYFNDIRNHLKNTPLMFHLVDEDFAVSTLGPDPNINALKSKIFETAQKHVYWGKEIPARWIPLERALMKLKNENRIPVMDYRDVKGINDTRQVRIESTEEFDLFLMFEHDIGNIVFFNSERLRNKVVFDPEWLIHGVKIWITSDQLITRHPELSDQWFAFKDTGKLTSTLIERLWESHSEIHQHQEYLLDIMEELNIIAKPHEPKEFQEQFYWVPSMVSVLAPDDVKKLQQNKDTTKTSTLCFRSKTNFIHIGVFHRLLATCLSKWAPAKEGNRYLLFRGLCVFDLDEQQELLLSLNDFVIHATVIRFTKKNRNPDLPLCMTIRDNLHSALSEISDCLCPGSEFEICIKCNESSPLTNEGLHSITTMRAKDELKCSTHTHKEAHCVESAELLKFWEEDKKQMPPNVLPQQWQATERFTRVYSLVIDVGTKVLRKVLIYYITSSSLTIDQYMKNKEPDIRNLKRRKVLNKALVDLIFPLSGQTDVNKYDITLTSALLNNVCPSLGQQEKQFITDLRTERNNLAHSHSTKMSEQDFQTKWTDITTRLTNLSKLCKDPIFDNEIQNEIQDIQRSGSDEITSKLIEMKEELKRLYKLLEDIDTTQS